MDGENIQHRFLHVDLDAFFASVEQLDHPEYRGKPLIVGGKPEDRRGVVSTASYEARKFGVHSAMPVYQAYRLCPQGIFVHGRMKRYAELSYQIMTIFKDFSPDVQQMSIDEAFIDLTGTEKLFGPAEETALKIKQRVKAETGLTVSVGLATTKYLAKIASGYSKPDGFYYVKPGEETSFMLNLPLDKIWGVGNKTLELIKSKGFKTTRDIYEKDVDILQFMFGKNLGSFLYNAVRGNEKMSFNQEAKKHSISAETTFAYDITDVYTAETALMELCYGVYFRLLREESYSRTATLKLRYEDFSTINVQETFDRNILTLDSFYEKVKALFERKYITGRGIRLLGVGFDSVETEDRPYQQDLFETENSKKAEIEKAILKLSKKHPEIKVQKARMLNKKLKAFILGLGLFALSAGHLNSILPGTEGSRLFAKENSTTAKGAAALLPDTFENPDSDQSTEPVSLFNWDISDSKNVEFLISGYWQAQFENNLSAIFGKNQSLSVGFGVPVFKQEVDISFQALLNKHWLVEADFADEFEKNTISFGYKGDRYLQTAKISNRNITMPDLYAANTLGYGISGGDSQSPGISLHYTDYASSKWSADFLLRYDMTEEKNATFYGLNSTADSYISIDSFIYGRTFVFPEAVWSCLSDIDSIYVESRSGTIADANGKKYKKLTVDQYLILSSAGKLLLSSDAQSGLTSTSSSTTSISASYIPEILVTFKDGQNSINKIENSLGSYNDSESWLGKIQTLFTKYSLSDYAFKLTASVTDEKLPALVIQNGTGFSPFLACQTYDCGIITEAEVSVISKASEAKLEDYKAVLTSDEAVTTVTNFFSENHKYAKVSLSAQTDSDLQNPANRYPFAEVNPEIYLNLEPKTDTCLLVRTYTKVSSLYIGNDAIAGTVQVYKNGVLDSGAKYSSVSGNVELSSTLDATDKIYITWQEDSTDSSSQALVSGAGITYNFTDNLKVNSSLTSRWPVSPLKKYSTADSGEKAFTALSAGINYQKNHFSITDKLTVALENQNGTGILLASTQNTEETKTFYLTSDSGFVTNALPSLNLKKETGPVLLKENKYETTLSPALTEPSKITGYKIPLSFDFSQTAEADGVNNQNFWTSIDIHLTYGYALKNSSQVEIALQNSCDLTGYDLYLQLGITAGSTFYGEETDLIPTWKINGTGTDGNYDFTSTEWQNVVLELSDIDRSRLSSAHDARLIIVKPADKEVFTNTGTVYFGPYEPYTQQLFVSASDNIFTTTVSYLQETEASQLLGISENYASKVSWLYLSEPEAADSKLLSDNKSGDTEIAMSRYFTAADFSSYKEICFDFAFSGSISDFSYAATSESSATENLKPELTLILDTMGQSTDQDGTAALKLVLSDVSTFCQNTAAFHTITVDVSSKKVFVDSEQLASSEFELYINKAVIPCRQKVVLSTVIDNAYYSSGSFTLDNLYYKGTTSSVSAINFMEAAYTNQTEMVKIKAFPLVKNADIDLNSTQSLQLPVSSIKDTTAQVSYSGNATITLADFILSADASGNSTSSFLQNAGHSVKTEKPVSGILSFSENYRYSQEDSSSKKSDEAYLDFSKIKFPLKLSLNASSGINSASSAQNQNTVFNTAFTPSIKNTRLSFTSQLSAVQKISGTCTTGNYFNDYKNLSLLEFSTGQNDAEARNLDFLTKAALSLPKNRLSVSLEYNLSSAYTPSDSDAFSDTHLLKFSIPFTAAGTSFSAAYTRTGIGAYGKTQSDSYITDSQKVLSQFNSRQYFYTAIPLYDLFQKDYSRFSVLDSNQTSNTLSSRYELIWKRKLLNSYKDMLIPSAASFALCRDIQSGETVSDIYQLKTIISSNAINNFGSKSRLHWFKWYNQDEIQSSLTGILKIPYGKWEETVFQAAAYSQLLLYITDKNSVQTAFDFSIETDLDWSFRTTLIWSRSGKNSFIIPVLLLIKPLKNSSPKWKITRKDTFNFQIGRTDLTNNQLYEFNHNLELNFLKYYTITSGVGFSFNYIQNGTDTAALNFSVGGKMEF